MIRTTLLLNINLIFSATVCGQNLQIKKPTLTELPDRYSFIFQTSMSPSLGHTVLTPFEFSIDLPKKLVSYEIDNGSDFGFYFDHGQVIFIKCFYNESISSKDTVYIPSRQELEDLIAHELMTTHGAKYDIKEMEYKPSRISTIIKKQNILILLFNVKKNANPTFLKMMATYKKIG